MGDRDRLRSRCCHLLHRFRDEDLVDRTHRASAAVCIAYAAQAARLNDLLGHGLRLALDYGAVRGRGRERRSGGALAARRVRLDVPPPRLDARKYRGARAGVRVSVFLRREPVVLVPLRVPGRRKLSVVQLYLVLGAYVLS